MGIDDQQLGLEYRFVPFRHEASRTRTEIDWTALFPTAAVALWRAPS
jgi:hypothetical protein